MCTRLLGVKLDCNVVEAAVVVARLAVRSADPGEFGQLECDVFDDVTEVSTFFESRHEAARLSQTAMVIFYSWKNCEESFIEAFELTTLAFGKLTEIQTHEQHWMVAIDIRTVECANAFDLHTVLAFQLHLPRHCQFSCQ